MASIVMSCSVAVPGFHCNKSPLAAGVVTPRPRRVVVVRAEAQGINLDIRKTEDKVVDSVVVTELSKPLTAYCRCWRSGSFPLCDGSHVKHNKATGDNVGPLLLKKQFGDFMALFGAFGCIPLDFILPMVFYNVTFKPSKQSFIFWVNTLIAVASSGLVAVGAVASVRQIALDAKAYSSLYH